MSATMLEDVKLSATILSAIWVAFSLSVFSEL